VGVVQGCWEAFCGTGLGSAPAPAAPRERTGGEVHGELREHLLERQQRHLSLSLSLFTGLGHAPVEKSTGNCASISLSASSATSASAAEHVSAASTAMRSASSSEGVGCALNAAISCRRRRRRTPPQMRTQ
jgi:hypothetical protein